MNKKAIAAVSAVALPGGILVAVGLGAWWLYKRFKPSPDGLAGALPFRRAGPPPGGGDAATAAQSAAAQDDGDKGI